MVKYAVLVLLNSDGKQNPKKPIQGIRKRLIDMGYTRNLTDDCLENLVKAIKKKHLKINKWIASGIGVELMRLDSDKMEDILVKLMDQGIFAIPVHDSLVVEKQHKKALIEQMDKSYYKFVEWHPVID